MIILLKKTNGLCYYIINKKEVYLMFTNIFTLFWKLNPVETWAVHKMDELLAGILKGGFGIKKMVAAFSAITQLFNFMAFRKPIQPFGDELDLTGYELVYADEFEGDSLNLDDWYHRANGPSYHGFYAPDTVSVHDGNLHIGGRYVENGTYGSGWYADEVALKQKYTRGYFECRCICSGGNGFWSAFWLQNSNSGQKDSKGGVYGVELDVCEALAENSEFCQGEDAILQCLHTNGGTGDTDDDTDSSGSIFFYGNNIYKEYNTYGVMWNEEEYIFYVNGKETLRTSWCDGVSTVPEEVILSVCIPQANLDKMFARDYSTDFVVDYVRIYQMK